MALLRPSSCQIPSCGWRTVGCQGAISLPLQTLVNTACSMSLTAPWGTTLCVQAVLALEDIVNSSCNNSYHLGMNPWWKFSLILLPCSFVSHASISTAEALWNMAAAWPTAPLPPVLVVAFPQLSSVWVHQSEWLQRNSAVPLKIKP